MEQIIDEDFHQFNKKIIRRELLPWWIKFFCWVFMILGAGAVLGLIYGLFKNELHLSIYGFESEKPFSLMGIFIFIILTLKGFSAYLLWFEKDNAVYLAKIDAIFGIVLCMISMVIIPFVVEGSHFFFRGEILFLIAYLIKLNGIEYAWDNLEEQ